MKMRCYGTDDVYARNQFCLQQIPADFFRFLFVGGCDEDDDILIFQRIRQSMLGFLGEKACLSILTGRHIYFLKPNTLVRR